MKRVLCLGLTPVLQRTLVFERLEVGEVNRVGQVVESAGGKAVNAARVLATLGVPVAVAGLNGGATGQRVVEYLTSYGVETSTLTLMQASTRICTSLVDSASGSATELVEEAPEPERGEVERFVRDNLRRISEASLLLIMGTLPVFVGDDFYRQFVGAAVAAGVPVVVDSHRAGLLSVLSAKPLLVKLNARELAVTLGRALPDEGELLAAMRELCRAGAGNVLVTRGARAALLLSSDGESWRLEPPAIRQCLNAVGSGDSTAAGIACGLLQGYDMRRAAALGLACGSANAETLTPGEVSAERVDELSRTGTDPDKHHLNDLSM